MLPTWIEKRYKYLWEGFKESSFRFEDAAKILKDKMRDDERQVNVFLSELRKGGWLEVEFNREDARKRIYKLKSIEEIVSETLAIGKGQLTRGDLESLLKGAADLIRTRVDYAFILVLLFYKRISDKWGLEFDKAYKEALADGLKEEEAKEEAKNSIYHDFDISEELLWENIRKDPARLPENFSKAMKILAERNPELKDVFEMLAPRPGQRIYDPACGSGGMLIISFKHVENEQGKGEAEKLFLFGQEANHKTLALAKMNLYIHDIRNAQLTLGDTLLYPKFKESERVKDFDMVIANPPWNQDGYNEEILKKGEFWRERFRYGFTPRQSADWAWIEHMLASANDKTGRVGVVIDNGCLFRGGKEKGIREDIINADLIVFVMLLPEKLFYNTGAPGAVMVLNKNKPGAREGKIFFINASKEYRQHPEVRKLNQLGDEHIKKIVKAYKKFINEEGFWKI